MDRMLIGPMDLIFLPPYFLLLYFFAIQIRKRHPTDFLIQKYFVKGLVIKMMGAIFFALLAQYYYGYGDTMTYYRETLLMREAVAQNKISILEIFTTDYDFLREKYDWRGGSAESGFFVEKITFILTYFSFSRFLLTACLMTGLTYFGIFKLFKVFVSIIPEKHKIISYFVLFFPSLVIYGSGIFKDPVCFSALGWLFYATYNITKEKKITVTNIFILVFSFWVIVVVKSYIIAAFMVPLSFSLAMKALKNVKSAFVKIVVFPILIFSIVGAYNVFSADIEEMLGEFAVEKLAENVQGQKKGYASIEADSGSSFVLGEFEPTMAGVAKQLPIGMIVTFYRPYIWEVRKPIIGATALESLFILLFTLYTLFKVGIFRFLKYIFTDSDVFLCIVFALLFGGLVGISTLNFGTLTRYRIPVIPFYLFGILLILHKGRSLKPNT
jgi:hypothetical protein